MEYKKKQLNIRVLLAINVIEEFSYLSESKIHSIRCPPPPPQVLLNCLKFLSDAASFHNY